MKIIMNLLMFTFISLLIGITVYSQTEMKVGNQIWMKENLKVDRFQNGDIIPEVKTASEWETAGAAGKPAWCFFNNDPSTEKTYGRLYNWYAVRDKRGLAPQGWSVASDDDYQSLISYFDNLRSKARIARDKAIRGKIIRARKVKKGEKPPKQLNIETGWRKYDGSFHKIDCNTSDCFGDWWTASESVTFTAGIVKFSFVEKHNELEHFGSLKLNNAGQETGLFVRCIKK